VKKVERREKITMQLIVGDALFLLGIGKTIIYRKTYFTKVFQRKGGWEEGIN